MSARLKLLHPYESLSQAKLSAIRRQSTERILASLEPGKPYALKAKPNGTVMDGNHRIAVLAERGFDLDSLEWEIV